MCDDPMIWPVLIAIALGRMNAHALLYNVSSTTQSVKLRFMVFNINKSDETDRKIIMHTAIRETKRNRYMNSSINLTIGMYMDISFFVCPQNFSH